MEFPYSVSAELDSRHREANVALLNKNYNAYRDIFAPDLVFQAKNGAAIDRGRLMRNVRAHNRRFVVTDIKVQREALREEGNAAVETVAHTATIEVQLFLAMRYRWTVNRISEFTWRRQRVGWQIYRAKILTETVSGRSFLWRM